jgi:pSer/pThr/pTyr-binding forkhead associated (FHA) protein
MAYFQFGDQQLKLNPGAQRLGPDGTGADIRLPSGDATATAVVVLNPDQTVIIKKADDGSVVLVNKVLLAEPLPLMHGDHVEIGGHDLRFGDTAKAGSTQFVSAADLAEIAQARAALPSRPTFATGGRLISLVDGRDYTVGDGGLVIGRDPAADIVVASTQVSRRHVQIFPGETGYVLTDLSTNGVWVNDQRVAQKQVLGKGDIIKVGEEEFRFYADARNPTIPPVAAETPPTEIPRAEIPRAETPRAETPRAETPRAETPRAETPRTETPPAIPAQPVPHAPRPSSNRPVLATLLVTGDGLDKGKRFDVIGPLTNIGRGEHNDFVLASESVSDSHAKLQKRESGWVLVDINSTNGTFVGGRRIAGEQPMKGAPDLRFGDVRVAFRPGAEPVDEGKSTRVMPLTTAEEARKIAATRRSVEGMMKSQPAPPAPAPIVIPQPEPEPEPVKSGSPIRIWLLVLALLSAVAAYLIIGSTL